MEKRERLTEQIILRVTPTEKKEIMNWVNNENTNLSDFIRNAIISIGMRRIIPRMNEKQRSKLLLIK